MHRKTELDTVLRRCLRGELSADHPDWVRLRQALQPFLAEVIRRVAPAAAHLLEDIISDTWATILETGALHRAGIEAVIQRPRYWVAMIAGRLAVSGKVASKSEVIDHDIARRRAESVSTSTEDEWIEDLMEQLETSHDGLTSLDVVVFRASFLHGVTLKTLANFLGDGATTWDVSKRIARVKSSIRNIIDGFLD